jgi:hypothetical protein
MRQGMMGSALVSIINEVRMLMWLIFFLH